MLPWFIWKNFSIMPDPTQSGFNWNSQALETQWSAITLVLLVATFLVYGYYYFWTKPSEGAVRRFVFYGAGLLVGAAFYAFYSLNDLSNLFMEASPWLQMHTIVTALAGVLTEFEIIIFVVAVYLILSLIPTIPWHLRAMRRYPFKWVP